MIRAAVFLRAADLISTKYRYHLLATTIIGQVQFDVILDNKETYM